MRVTSNRFTAVSGALLACSLAIGGGTVVPVAAGEPVALQPGADGVQRITITLDSYSYSPDHIIAQVGKPVELTLASVTTITPHNFIITELGVEQDVGAGKTVTVRFTPMQPGAYLFYCDKKLLFLPSHREKGMEGHLEVR